ncbi:MAG: hypothetical protein ACRD98_01815 [Nitrososphaera sp.]
MNVTGESRQITNLVYINPSLFLSIPAAALWGALFGQLLTPQILLSRAPIPCQLVTGRGEQVSYPQIYLWDFGRRKTTMTMVATIAIAAANWVLLMMSLIFIIVLNIAQYE